MRPGGRHTIMPHGFCRHDHRRTVSVHCIGVAAIVGINFFDTANVYGERHARILQVSAVQCKHVLTAHAVVARMDI